MLLHEIGPAPDAPLYAEVRGRIVDSLRRAEWGHGGRIPTEPQLAQRYGVSIGTVRKAVDALVVERILLRRPGRGTFVASHMDEAAFAQFLQMTDAAGRRVVPRAVLRSFANRRAPAEAAARLGLRAGSSVLSIENLRLLQDRPVMLDHIWVPRPLLAGLRREEFAARPGSIYGFYQERGLTVIRIEEELCALAAKPDVAEALGLTDGSPVMLVRRTAFSYGPDPIEFRHRYVPAGTIRYRNSMGLRLDEAGRPG